MELEDGNYTMSCDCADNDGFPCRHIGCILDLTADHFAPRYHKRFCHFGEKKFPAGEGTYFAKKLKDTRLVITSEEKELAISKALANSQGKDEQFWNKPKTQCFQRCKLQEFEDIGYNGGLQYNTGLEQEVGLSQEDSDGEFPHVNEEETYLADSPTTTGSYYHDVVAMVTQVEHATMGNTEYRNRTLKLWKEAYAQCMALQPEYIQASGERKRQADSEYIDLFHGTDRRKQCKRMKSSCEPHRAKNTTRYSASQGDNSIDFT